MKRTPQVGDRARYVGTTAGTHVGRVAFVTPDHITVTWVDGSFTHVRPAGFVPAKAGVTETEWEIVR